MELIKVSAAKLKIILSAEDMRVYGIGMEDLNAAAPQARKAFRRIFERAKTQTGFETGSGRLYVRVFESMDGGCEVFVSKKAVMLPEPDERAPRDRTAGTADEVLYGEKTYIASCTEFEDMVSLCVRLHDTGFAGRSALYYHAGAYVLYLKLPRQFPSFAGRTGTDEDGAAENRYCFIGDYADVVCADALTTAVLNEHAAVLAASDAVDTIARTFEKNDQTINGERHGQ